MAKQARMTCRRAIDLLADYLEATLGPEVATDLEQHLEGCAPCRAYLATYAKTRAVAASAARAEMPAEMQQRVRQFLLKALKRA